jgi:hypothetical protein
MQAIAANPCVQAASLGTEESRLGSDGGTDSSKGRIGFRIDGHAKLPVTIKGKTITDFKTNIDLI